MQILYGLYILERFFLYVGFSIVT